MYPYCVRTSSVHVTTSIFCTCCFLTPRLMFVTVSLKAVNFRDFFSFCFQRCEEFGGWPNLCMHRCWCKSTERPKQRFSVCRLVKKNNAMSVSGKCVNHRRCGHQIHHLESSVKQSKRNHTALGTLPLSCFWGTVDKKQRGIPTVRRK